MKQALKEGKLSWWRHLKKKPEITPKGFEKLDRMCDNRRLALKQEAQAEAALECKRKAQFLLRPAP